MQPRPPVLRCRTAPDPGAQRSTLIRTVVPPLKTAPSAPAFCWFILILAARTPFSCTDFDYFS